jgi:predicted PurR-regulated permease PerM
MTGGAPRWLRDIGTSAWLLLGVGLCVVGLVGILSLTRTIVMPLLAAGLVAAVASPVVRHMGRRGIPRGAATGLLMLAVVALGGLMTVLVIGGITSQTDDLTASLTQAKAELAKGLDGLGVEPATAESATEDAGTSAGDGARALIDGLTTGIAALSSLVVFLSLTLLCLIFLLKDGPEIRAWVEGHMGMPPPLARTVTARTLQSLRGYFGGMTVVAAFNAVVVGVAALLLGVPLAGTIAAVTFFAAYVPYLGAWAAGAFSVLIALGGAGPEAALGMTVVQLLANSILQQLVQPIAFGAALGLHPLAVLIVTIAGGGLFGAAGLILSAPVTSAVVRVANDLSASPAEAAPT